MAGTINLFGKAIPRTPFLFGLVGAAGVTGYILWRKHAQGGSAVPSAAGYGYGTGYGYGAGYGYGLGIAQYGYGLSGGFGYGFGYGGISPGVGVSVPPVATAPASNSLWASAAESALSADGFNPATVAAALGKYLTGGTLTSDQTTIVQAAIGVEGYPPVAGADGYPPKLHTQASTGQTQPGGAKPGSGKGKLIGKRHVATGLTSLDKWATANKTVAGEVENTTEQNFQDGYMSTANHTKFTSYLNRGANKQMPPGLIFFSTK